MNFEKINKYLFYGVNSIFTKRMYELTKRIHSSEGIDYNIISKVDDNFHFDFLESEKLISYSIHLGSDILVVSSEVLYCINREEDFNKFFRLISEISKSNKVKLLYISVLNPLRIKYEENKDALYLSEPTISINKIWINKVLEVIDKSNNLIYEFDSFISYCVSEFEQNPFYLLKKYKDKEIFQSLNFCFSFNSADSFISDILKNQDDLGLLKSQVKTYSMELREFRNILNSLLQDTNTDGTWNNDDLDIVAQVILNVVHQSECSIQLLYRKQTHEIVNNKHVANWRFSLGEYLIDSVPLDIMEQIDCIVPVPETGKYYAQGLAFASKKPYIEAFYKKQVTGRSYDIQNSDKRKDFINNKLGIHKGILNGKSIGLVDEAIFTGATLKIACNLLFNENVNNIFIIIPSPTCKIQCKFNMQPTRTLLMDYIREEDLYKYFDVNGVYLQNFINYEKVMHLTNFNCTECFNV